MSWRSPRLLPVLALLAAAPAAGAAPPSVPFTSAAIRGAAAGLAPGSWLFVTGVPLAAGEPARLELLRFEVFAPDARIVVHGERGEGLLAPPANAYFHGFVTGDPWSQAYLTVRAAGEIRGLVTSGGRSWLFSDRGVDGPAPVVREVDPAAIGPGFECLTDRLTGARPAAPAAPAATPAVPAPAPRGGEPTYAARVAVETDFEYFQQFANATDAVDYTADLVGFSSGIYTAEVDTRLHISFLSLWETAADPWTQTSSVCALFEFGRYWNDNYGGQAGGSVYTVAHMMSGKNSGGGVAWVGVLCADEFNYNQGNTCPGMPAVDNYGGPYGYSGAMDGDFDPGTGTVVWDLVVVSHEIGHNFDSPHSHCYNGIGGAQPVDMCYGQEGGCYNGPPSLPCPDPPGPGSGCGTLMSYCHLLAGGIANMAPTFGLGHPWGVDPERIPSRMNDHVVATHAGAPACLDPLAELFSDDFETGTTGFWDQTAN